MTDNNKRLKPTEVPEETIAMLAVSLGIDTDVALDLIMFIGDELREQEPPTD